VARSLLRARGPQQAVVCAPNVFFRSTLIVGKAGGTGTWHGHDTALTVAHEISAPLTRAQGYGAPRARLRSRDSDGHEKPLSRDANRQSVCSDGRDRDHKFALLMVILSSSASCRFADLGDP
jgi:hypothetical protein